MHLTFISNVSIWEQIIHLKNWRNIFPAIKIAL